MEHGDSLSRVSSDRANNRVSESGNDMEKSVEARKTDEEDVGTFDIYTTVNDDVFNKGDVIARMMKGFGLRTYYKSARLPVIASGGCYYFPIKISLSDIITNVGLSPDARVWYCGWCFYIESKDWSFNVQMMEKFYKSECSTITGVRVTRDGNPDPLPIALIPSSTVFPQRLYFNGPATDATVRVHFAVRMVVSQNRPLKESGVKPHMRIYIPSVFRGKQKKSMFTGDLDEYYKAREVSKLPFRTIKEGALKEKARKKKALEDDESHVSNLSVFGGGDDTYTEEYDFSALFEEERCSRCSIRVELKYACPFSLDLISNTKVLMRFVMGVPSLLDQKFELSIPDPLTVMSDIKLTFKALQVKDIYLELAILTIAIN